MGDDDEPDLFDAADARKARDEAMDAVEEAADEDWKDVALSAVLQAAEELPLLTADHVMERIKRTGAETHELRALGPVMLKAARNGWIEKANQTVLCKRRSRHAAPLTVWRSLLFRTSVAVAEFV